MQLPVLISPAGLLEWARRVRLTLNPIAQGYPFQQLDTAPTGVDVGFSYYDTTLDLVRTWDGTNWIAAGGGGILSGTSFPGSPTTGDRFFRSDRNIDYVYDGTRWLSTQIFPLVFSGTSGGAADTGVYAPIPWQNVYGIWLVRFEATTFRTAAGEWDVVLNSQTATSVKTAVVTLDGNGTTTNNWVMLSSNIGAVQDVNGRSYEVVYDEISGTSTLFATAILYYRLIG